MPVNHEKEYLIFVHIDVVFLHFLARASNGRQYSNFENKCPKLGTGTPEDMVLTNLGDSLDSDPSGFVLLQKCEKSGGPRAAAPSVFTALAQDATYSSYHIFWQM